MPNPRSNKSYTKDILEASEKSDSLVQKLKAISSSISSNFNLPNISRDLYSNIPLPTIDTSMFSNLGMPNWNNIIPNSNQQTIQQHVEIENKFPGVTDHIEIETAMNNLINGALQYAK